MTTVLCANLYQAARKVYKRPVKELKSLPVLDCIHIQHTEGRLALTTRADLGEPLTEYVPARIDYEFETCVPMRPFKDWLYTTGAKSLDQIHLDFDPLCEILTMTTGRAKAEFKCINAQEFPCHR